LNLYNKQQKEVANMQTVSLELPDELAQQIKFTPRHGSATSEKLQMLLAIGLFVSKEISLAKAAELAGQSLMEFMGILKFLGIPAITYTEEMYENDQKFVNAAW
jgi:predicted HTH domain antitoxin